METEIRKGWVIIWEGMDEFRAHLIKGILEAHNIPAVIYNQLDSAYMIRYLHKNATIKVLVPEQFYDQAITLLNETQGTQEPSD
ncbi:MAG: DUF2007 domain-containing protein [Chlorobi bacterium]|nr:DUF2007 domain-containing protein [Chlorobiota bacterium]